MSGRAKTDAVSISMVAADATSQMRVQHGLTPALGSTSATASASAIGDRLVVELGSLPAGTVRHYQAEGKLAAGGEWSSSGPIQQTKTAAASGAACSSIHWADSHITKQLAEPETDPDRESRYAAFLTHIAALLPDFYASHGDELVSFQFPDVSSQADMDAWWALWRNFTAPALGMRPFYMIGSNHHQRCGYTMEPDPGDYHQRWQTIAEKRYLLNPDDGENDATLAWKGGETGPKVEGASEGNVNPLENYYAWSQGDADFFAITPFRYTRIGEDTGPTDRSQWTLGAEQLAWFEAALAASTARWKVVLAHHVIGSCDEGPYGRCGTADVLHADNYMADTGDGEGLHEKMEAGGVTHFVKAHDHLLACGWVGTINYVTCSSPSKVLGPFTQADYGYETDDFWLQDYGYAELAWAGHQCVVKLHRLEYDGAFNVTDTVVHTEVTSDLAPVAIRPTIWKGVTFEDSGITSLARVMGNGGATIVQADMATIHRSIYNAATGVAIEEGALLTVADVVFDALQTDSRTEDAIGYNFRDAIPATKFATGDEVYQVEYKFTPNDGEAWHVVFQHAIKGVRGS